MLKIKVTLLMLICIAILSCQSEYDKMVKTELQSGEIYKDLIFDLTIGQTKKEFYTICWELNKNEKITHGSGNQYAKYVVPVGEIFEEPDKVEMLFYGIFDEEDIMIGMDMRFSYPKWAIWNTDYHSDKLIERLKKHYVHKYGGNDFMDIKTKLEKHPAYVKVDGNRQILIYPINSKDIVVKIEDLRFKYSHLVNGDYENI